MQPTNFENSVDLLNQLLVIHYRSLPMYLVDASPWTHRGDEKATEALHDIVTDQRQVCQRIADSVIQRGGIVAMGDYPTEFTDMNFLSLDYLVKRLIELQQQAIEAIGGLADRLWNDPPAQSLAKESLGAAKAHLQALQELTAQMSNAG
ncbi:MAG: hypothetical protein GTO53_09775 [Planctomycetales bacterium]|nr:hypothetical protein [Planctomycetales bacterium]NIM09411.1 hypothetical protein [Planctomycetales bacterium]NIN08889.1 hypothetical protein [Planctomycetales bacterium]NIN78004.1 hypothetical protein [Planctomycetales bacterium]NIO35192.1 hypothetical protein [Planctomycetales bacterium]